MNADTGCGGCRRKNFVQAAYVEAAVYVNRMFGSDRAYWMLIREKVPPSVIERVLKGKDGRVRHKDRRYSTRRQTIIGPDSDIDAMPLERRVDQLTSQRIEVALVFQSMLGVDSAQEYLRNNMVPVWVAARVLSTTKRRASLPLAVEF